jgi:hypothetical protein
MMGAAQNALPADRLRRLSTFPLAQVMVLMDKAAHATDLCLVCGLCCQGIVHSHAALDTSELDLARELSLRVDMFEDGTGFHLPCPQYQGDRCATYQRRPHACANYQCELLQRFLGGGVSLEDSLSLITQAKVMLDKLWTRLPDGKATPITFQTLRTIVGKESRMPNA